jgi:hypothetical protein
MDPKNFLEAIITNDSEEATQTFVDLMNSKLSDALEVKKVEIASGLFDEAVRVKKSPYSWGKMITVRDSSSQTFPLHPEHQKAIAKLKDGESTSFTDETNTKVTAHRKGGYVHLSQRGSNTPTPVAMSHFLPSLSMKEEVEQVDEASLKQKIKTNLRKIDPTIKLRLFDRYAKHSNAARNTPDTYGKGWDKYKKQRKNANRFLNLYYGEPPFREKKFNNEEVEQVDNENI